MIVGLTVFLEIGLAGSALFRSGELDPGARECSDEDELVRLPRAMSKVVFASLFEVSLIESCRLNFEDDGEDWSLIWVSSVVADEIEARAVSCATSSASLAFFLTFSSSSLAAANKKW